MSGKGSATLTFAVRKRVVVWLLGQLLLPLVGLALVPLVVALAFAEFGFSIRCAIVAVVLLAAGWSMARVEASLDVRPNEAMVATVLVFIVGATAMTWPLSGAPIPALDAWFESVSAITTTGLTTLSDVESRSPAFLFTRAWMQWYGGLAIVVLAVVLILAPGLAARRLGETESGAPDVIGGVRTRARYALVVYVLLTAIAFFLLVLAGATPFDALAYAFSAVSTGGFSTHNNGLAGLGNLPVEWVPIGMAFCGAVSLTLYAHIRQGRWRDAIRNKNLHAFAWTTLASATLVSVFLMTLDGFSVEDALWHGPLVAISAQTTSGFSSVDISTLSAPSKLTLIGSMFIGGEEGSTAGGIKIPRLLILMALVRTVLMRTRLPPHAVSEPVAAGRRIEDSELHAALAVIILHAVVILLSWMAFVACGHDVLDALFDVTSAVGTVGLSAGIVNENLAAGLKWLLTADMLMGRLEVVAVIVLFSPATWFGRRSEAL